MRNKNTPMRIDLNILKIRFISTQKIEWWPNWKKGRSQPAITFSKLTIETLEQGELTIKTPERRHWRRSGVLTVNFEHISQLVLVFLLLTFNRLIPAGSYVNVFDIRRDAFKIKLNIKIELFVKIVNGSLPLFSQKIPF